MRVDLINDIELYEGFVGAIMFPLLKFIFLDRWFLNRYVTTALAWFITWFFRRFITNIVYAYKKEHGLKITNYHINVPFVL